MNQSAIQRQGYAVQAAATCSFSDVVEAFPAVPVQETDSTTTVTQYIQVFNSTTQQWESVLVSAPAYWKTFSASGQRQTFPTLKLNVTPGLKKHRLFCYITFSSFVPSANNLPFWDNSGGVHYYGWASGQSISFDGVLTGTINIYSNGTSVGKIPLATGQAGTATTCTQCVNPSGTPIVKSLGALQVLTPFDSVQQLPTIDFNGACDLITVDAAAIYNTSGAAGSMYIAIVSTN